MAQLDYALIDVDFFDKPKVKGLIFRHGNDGALFLLRCILLLSRSTDGECSQDALYGLGYEMRLSGDEVTCILEYCVEHGMLAQLGDIYQNSRVLQDQKKLETKRERTKNRVERYREKSNADVTRYSSVTNDSGNALQTRYPVTVTVTDPVTVFDINIKELDTPEIRQALSMFASKLASQNRELNQLTLDPMLMRYAGRPQDFHSALLYSASLTKCVNLIDPPQNARGSPQSASKSRTERNLESTKNALREIGEEYGL